MTATAADIVLGFSGKALCLFGGAGGLLALAWFATTGRRFLTPEA